MSNQEPTNNTNRPILPMGVIEGEMKANRPNSADQAPYDQSNALTPANDMLPSSKHSSGEDQNPPVHDADPEDLVLPMGVKEGEAQAATAVDETGDDPALSVASKQGSRVGRVVAKTLIGTTLAFGVSASDDPETINKAVDSVVTIEQTDPNQEQTMTQQDLESMKKIAEQMPTMMSPEEATEYLEDAADGVIAIPDGNGYYNHAITPEAEQSTNESEK